MMKFKIQKSNKPDRYRVLRWVKTWRSSRWEPEVENRDERPSYIGHYRERIFNTEGEAERYVRKKLSELASDVGQDVQD